MSTQAGVTNKWNIKPSKRSLNTINPIRSVVDNIKIPKNTTAEKPLIPLSLGDPSIFGNLPPPESSIISITRALIEGKSNGYAPSHGKVHARKAIAEKFSIDNKEDNIQHILTEEDICITSGCSGALRIAFSALSGEGDNVLIPKPGFGLYKTICGNNNVEPRQYKLIAENDWQVDLKHMESLIDENTKFILINNPSNPCGAVYNKKHLLDIIKIAEQYCLPIISDEIYGNMIFPTETFYSIASLTNQVPIIVTSGIAKQYCCPGWRVGWIVLYDSYHRMNNIKLAIRRLSQVIVGSNTLIQEAIPDMLFKTSPNYFATNNKILQENALFLYEQLLHISGLIPIKPKGAMYIMVKLDLDVLQAIKNDVDFVQKLLDQEFVFVLPGSAFSAENFIRIVFAAPIDILTDACNRIQSFCKRYSTNKITE